MFENADRGDETADKAADPIAASLLREAAEHWRTTAICLNLLEREPVYRIIRDREN